MSKKRSTLSNSGRPTPAFWWDFDADMDVIVQSDWKGGECLARFGVVEGATAEGQIAQAESLIADFIAGRKTPQWGVSA